MSDQGTPAQDWRAHRWTRFDGAFALTTGIPAVGALISFFLAPGWAIAVATVLLALVPCSVFAATRRRRTAFAVRAAAPGSAEAGRAAAKLHLQEICLVLLAIGLFFAAGGVLTLR